MQQKLLKPTQTLLSIKRNYFCKIKNSQLIQQINNLSMNEQQQILIQIQNNLSLSQKDNIHQEININEINDSIDKNNIQSSEINNKQLFQFCIGVMLPNMGFGFIDNFLMILFGESIEQFISVATVYPISTMACAGLGNTFSDACGVYFSDTIDRCINKIKGKETVQLTQEQILTPRVQKYKTLSALFGMVLGCLIGMFPLLFMKNNNVKNEQKCKDE